MDPEYKKTEYYDENGAGSIENSLLDNLIMDEEESEQKLP